MSRKYLILIIACVLVAVFIFSLFIVNLIKKSGTGGLQITSNVKAKVFLNGADVGTTPLCKCDQNNTLKIGEYSLKIIPDEQSLTPFEYKIKIQKNIMTVVDRTFLPGAYSNASILYLDKTDGGGAELLVNSLPDGALVSLDGNSSGVTPLAVKSISPSEHEIEIIKTGFSKKTIKIKTVAGYRLIIDTILGTQVEANSQLAPASASAKTGLNSKPTQGTNLKINDTPTGFLRVREGPGTSFAEVGRVKPGETYTWLEEKDNWFKIQLGDGTSGWVSGDFTSKISSAPSQ